MRLMDIPEGLLPFMGESIGPRLTGARKRAFLANLSGMRANYGNTVDAALCDKQILFSDETRELLYSEPWERTDYKTGTRPELECAVADLAEGESSEFRKVIALMRFTKDLYKKYKGRILFDGGTEEELIKKGEQLCESLSRLLVALCEVAGIAGRIVTHCGGGHLSCEIFADRKWGYFDPRTGIYFLKPDGAVASVAELFDDPTIMDGQPDLVKREVSERWSYDVRLKKCKEMFFNKSEVTTFKPYSLADSQLYDYSWRSSDDEFASGLWRTSIEYGEAQAELFGFDHGGEIPHIEFTVAEGQLIGSPIAVLALPTSAVAPSGVRFFIDGKVIYETPKITPPENVHNAIKGAFRLFGERGMLDPAALSPGTHTLYAEVSDEPIINGGVTFIIP